MALATAAHVEHAKTVVVRQELDNIERLHSAASQSMQVHDALTVQDSLIILNSLPAMSDERALDSFVPSVLDVMQILDKEPILIEIER